MGVVGAKKRFYIIRSSICDPIHSSFIQSQLGVKSDILEFKFHVLIDLLFFEEKDTMFFGMCKLQWLDCCHISWIHLLCMCYELIIHYNPRASRHCRPLFVSYFCSLNTNFVITRLLYPSYNEVVRMVPFCSSSPTEQPVCTFLTRHGSKF